MADLPHNDTSLTLECEVEHEADRLAALVRRLRTECEQLRHALATAESDRDLYLKAVYANLRGTFDFGDVDLAELEKESAGPVETISIS